MMKKIFITFLILAVVVLSGCIQQTEKTQIANPASVYCDEQGGTLEIKTNEDGSQYGVCTLADGTICEEWAYYRGKCPEQENETKMPLLMGADAQETYNQKIIQKVDTIMKEVKKTKYTNRNYEMDEEKGIFYTDCSWFVDYVIKKVSGKHYDELPKRYSCNNYPLAADYFDYFRGIEDGKTESNCWESISTINDALPGDIIAYKHDKGSEEEYGVCPNKTESCDGVSDDCKVKTDGSTGHVMIIYSHPEWSSCDDKLQHYAKVADSAKSGHFEDTRDSGEYETGCDDDHCGIGIGKMWFNTGSNPYYRWSKCDGNNKQYANIAIGRAVEC